jgi:hypothetical protein
MPQKGYIGHLIWWIRKTYLAQWLIGLEYHWQNAYQAWGSISMGCNIF